MYTQAVSMKVTQEQFDRDLKQPLIELGYKLINPSIFNERDTLANNYLGNLGIVINIKNRDKERYNRYFIKKYNPDLFLSVCAMSDVPNGIVGEYIKYNGEIRKVLKGTSGNLFQKPTLQELINHFSNDKIRIGRYDCTIEQNQNGFYLNAALCLNHHIFTQFGISSQDLNNRYNLSLGGTFPYFKSLKKLKRCIKWLKSHEVNEIKVNEPTFVFDQAEFKTPLQKLYEKIETSPEEIYNKTFLLTLLKKLC
jgi:hypothetical protein